MRWRKKVDKTIQGHLELQIKESSKHKKAYRESYNPPNAQIWIAIANLSKQIHQLNSKINYLEKELYDAQLPEPKKKQKKAADLVESISQL